MMPYRIAVAKRREVETWSVRVRAVAKGIKEKEAIYGSALEWK